MKQYAVIALVAVILAAVAPGFAEGSGGAKSRRCNPAGAWYEEGGPPYVMSVVPIQGTRRFSLIFDGNFNPADLGFTSMTHWIGEMKKGDQGYDTVLIGVGGIGVFPVYDSVQTWGVAGIAEFDGNCRTLRFTWLNGIHAWVWDGLPAPVPFVDPVSFYPWPDDIVETYSRLRVPAN